ncbi:hypothetical protein PMAYCL1PPCAC_17192, partial [Pristionchus mayeri]
GLVGMALNVFLIVLLIRSEVGSTATLYFYSCIISAILSFYTAFWISICVNEDMQIAVIVDGMLIGAYYGPLLFLVPQWAVDFVCVAFLAQFIPAPCIIQWLSLSSFSWGTIRKMEVAYSVPIAFHILGWIVMSYFIPTEEFRNEMTSIVHRVHGTNLSDFHVYGLPLMDK